MTRLPLLLFLLLLPGLLLLLLLLLLPFLLLLLLPLPLLPLLLLLLPLPLPLPLPLLLVTVCAALGLRPCRAGCCGGVGGAGGATGITTGAGASQQFLSLAPTADSSLNKLVDCVAGLTKMQESFITQQSQHHQSKLDGLQSIHFTASNFIQRISSNDGQTMAPAHTPLATSMLSCKKKDVTLELFMLKLNKRGIRCQITPAFLHALFTGNIATKSASEIFRASSFGCAVSLAGTRLEDIDVSLTLRKADESENLSPKEKSALYGDIVLICTTANQLAKVLNITAAIFESYSGPHSLIAIWLGGWHDFAVEKGASD